MNSCQRVRITFLALTSEEGLLTVCLILCIAKFIATHIIHVGLYKQEPLYLIVMCSISVVHAMWNGVDTSHT